MQSSEEHNDNGKAANTERKLKHRSRRENQSVEEGDHRTWRPHHPAPRKLLKTQSENNRIFLVQANPCTNHEPSGNQVEIHTLTNSRTNQANFITNCQYLIRAKVESCPNPRRSVPRIQASGKVVSPPFGSILETSLNYRAYYESLNCMIYHIVKLCKCM